MVLDQVEGKWILKYGYAIKSWREKWEELTAFLEFPLEIRKIIYTTNIIENQNGKIIKYTKNKLSYPTVEDVLKSVFLALWKPQKMDHALFVIVSFRLVKTIFKESYQVLLDRRPGENSPL